LHALSLFCIIAESPSDIGAISSQRFIEPGYSLNLHHVRITLIFGSDGIKGWIDP